MRPAGRKVFIRVNPDGTIRTVIRKAVREGEPIPMNLIEITDPKEKEMLSGDFSFQNYLYDDNPEVPGDMITPFPDQFVKEGVKVIESPAVPFDPTKLYNKYIVAPKVKETKFKAVRVPYTVRKQQKPTDVERKISKKPKIRIFTDKDVVAGDGIDEVKVSLSNVPKAYTNVKLKVGLYKFSMDPRETVALTFNTPQTVFIELDEPRLIADPVAITVT